jgi:hypothetical protein
MATRKAYKKWGFYGLSVFTFQGMGADRIAQRARDYLPQDLICEGRVGPVLRSGWKIRRTGRTPGHHSIIFADKPSRADLDRFCKVFRKCKVNRYRRSLSK